MYSSFYPTSNPSYELHLTSQDASLFLVDRTPDLQKERLGMARYAQWSLERIAAEYLLRCSGTTTHGEIADSIGIPFRFVADRIGEFLAEETGAIRFESEPATAPTSDFFVTGSFDSLAPLHMSVEVTDGCNMRCDHCYVSAEPSNRARRNVAETLALFESMRRTGVKVVELTGGECTTHPGFKQIVEAACKNFHLVAVVSNGFLIGRRPNLARWLGQFGNLTAQISVDRIGAKHDAFRHKNGAFEAACSAVRLLKEANVLVRVAMTVTPENIKEVSDVFLLARHLGADAFAAAVVTSFGRGADLGVCSTTDHHLQHEISRQLSPYADDPLLAANRAAAARMASNAEINCGAGWRSFALNGATGEVRSCLFLSESMNLGSVDKEPYEDIFKSPYITMFRNAPSPSPALDTCHGCTYIGSCQGCFAKAFLVSQAEYPECPWRAQYFPGMPIEKLGPREMPARDQLKDTRARDLVPLPGPRSRQGMGS